MNYKELKQLWDQGKLKAGDILGVSEEELLQQIASELFLKVKEFWGVKEDIPMPPVEIAEIGDSHFDVKEKKVVINRTRLYDDNRTRLYDDKTIKAIL